jgi:hypothetical protein
VVESLGTQDSFVDRPLPDIIQDAYQHFGVKEGTLAEFTKKIRKAKNDMKRKRAKCRNYTADKCTIIPERRALLCEESSADKDTDVLEK